MTTTFTMDDGYRSRILKRIGPYHWFVSRETAAKFENFKQRNPHVYTVLLDLLYEYIAKTGNSACGLSLLWSRLRWEMSVNIDQHIGRMTEDERWRYRVEGAYKLPNRYAAGYARTIMANNPQFGPIFELRCDDPVACPACSEYEAMRQSRIRRNRRDDD